MITPVDEYFIWPALLFFAGAYHIWDNQRKIFNEIEALKFEIKLLKYHQTFNGFIDNQVHARIGAGPDTVRNFNLIATLSDLLVNRMSMEELKTMAEDLGLNGAIEWTTRASAVRTMLKDQHNNRSLDDIVGWIKKNRPDIKLFQ